MTPAVEYMISGFIVLGTMFAMVGSFGLVRLPDTMTRLHSPTKATTLGVGALLVASMIFFYVNNGKLAINELLITLFLFLTAPVAAHFIARAHMHLNCDAAKDLPRPNQDCEWSTYQRSYHREEQPGAPH